LVLKRTRPRSALEIAGKTLDLKIRFILLKRKILASSTTIAAARFCPVMKTRWSYKVFCHAPDVVLLRGAPRESR